MDILIFKKDKIDKTTVSQYSNQLNSDQKFISNQINQFSVFNQYPLYQYTYGEKESNGNFKFIDQKIYEMNMISSKKHVAVSNNMVTIKDQQFIFQENNLVVIDENNQKPDISLLNLYSQYVKYTKLVKYHFSKNHAVFFFFYRQYQKSIGVYFYLLISLQELKLLIQEQKFLLEEETKIFIPIEHDETKQIQFTHEEIYQYLGDKKYVQVSQNELVFELTRDISDPTRNFFPFMQYEYVKDSSVQKSSSEKCFRIFFCFLNVENAGDHLIQQKLIDKQDDFQINNFIQTFQIHFYQRADEPINYKDLTLQNTGMRKDVSGLNFRSSNMFCRSSNWEKNKVQEYYQAMFQLGFNVKQDDLKAIEIKEYLVRIESDRKIIIFPIKLKQIIFNKSYLNNILGVGSFFDNMMHENNRLIPQIDDDGNINGSSLLFNHKISFDGVWKITDDMQIINQNILKETALKLIGQYVFVIKKTNETFDAYSSDGQLLKGLSIQILGKQINESAHIYDVINLDDSELQLDQFNSIQNQMCKMSIQRNDIYSISTVTLNFKSTEQLNFTPSEQLYWLYYYQKNLMCTSLFSMGDLYIQSSKQIESNYLQPYITLQGQNKFHYNRKFIDIPQINALISLKLNEQNKNSHIGNSLVYHASQKNERFFKSMEMTQFFGYQSDVFKKISIIQCLVDANKLMEVANLVKLMIKNNPSQEILDVFIQDLPMIFEFQKVDFNEILNISEPEIESLSQDFSDSSKQNQNLFLCNIEQIMSNTQLKIFGPNEQIVHDPDDFQGIKFTVSEMKEIINKDRIDCEDNQVQYTFLNFQEMLRKAQIDLILQRSSEFCEYLKFFANEKSVICSHLLLAKMIEKCQEVQNFFEQSTTQNIIDIQFKKTRTFIEFYLKLFVFGFFVPYVYNCLSLIALDNIKDESLAHYIFRWILYLICTLTQIYFITCEIPEIAQSFQNYFKELFNLFDFSLPIFFLGHMILRVRYGKIQDFGCMQLADNIIEILIIMGSTLKLLQYIRYKEEYSYFVQMFFAVLVELGPFLYIFVIFIVVFTLFQIILGAKVSDESEYPGLHPYIRKMIQTFRVSIGDLQVTNYSQWAVDPEADSLEFSSMVRFIIVTLVWVFWIMDIYLILIVMLNLLIAQVGSIYEKIMSQGKTSIYKERAQLNLKVYQLLYYFGEKNEFVALIMQTPMESSDCFNFDDFITFTEKVKRSTQEIVGKMEKNVQKKILSFENNMIVANKLQEANNKTLENNMIDIKNTFENKIAVIDTKMEQVLGSLKVQDENLQIVLGSFLDVINQFKKEQVGSENQVDS